METDLSLFFMKLPKYSTNLGDCLNIVKKYVVVWQEGISLKPGKSFWYLTIDIFAQKVFLPNLLRLYFFSAFFTHLALQILTLVSLLVVIANLL